MAAASARYRSAASGSVASERSPIATTSAIVSTRSGPPPPASPSMTTIVRSSCVRSSISLIFATWATFETMATRAAVSFRMNHIWGAESVG